MNQELRKITSWLSRNKLPLNVKKPHFKTKRKKLNQTLSIEINNQFNNQKIDKVKCTKFLGLYIDDELTWKYHIDQITTKISKMAGIMARARHYLSIQTLKTIYNIMAHPYLTCCCVIWSSTYPTRLKSLFTNHHTEKISKNNHFRKISR